MIGEGRIGLGNRLLEGNRILCNRTQEKRTVTPRRLACGCPGVSSEGVGWRWPAAGLGAQSVAVHAWDLLRDITIIFITSTIIWPQVNSRERTQLHPSTENFIKDLLSMAPPHQNKTQYPPQSVYPIRKLP